MPELPEVETTLRGIEPYVLGSELTAVVVRNTSLRWPVPVDELESLLSLRVQACSRRAKYILLTFTDQRSLMLHLGMSGSIRVLPTNTPATKHDHIDLVFANTHIVRFNDPRRFGSCLVLTPPFNSHPLLNRLGPEPLTQEFDGDYLFARSRNKKTAIKTFIMDGSVVVGVGNIYASEALFMAGVRPTLAAGRLSKARYVALAECIKKVLAQAIKAGGTTLNDFSQADGKPGYFSQELFVYGRLGEPCITCGTAISAKVIGQRNSYFCTQCQSF